LVLVFSSLMKSFSQTASIEIAIRALVIAVCVSVAFGSSARMLSPSLVPMQMYSANDGTPANLPVEQSSIPEELPAESSNSNELPKEGETDAFALPKKIQKKHRCLFGAAKVDLGRPHQEQSVRIGGQIAASQFEYCYRNGCGANLRR
jgi:hypothetical protein